METVTVSEAAERTGWSARMLRYLESTGLVVPERSPSGYRRYGEHELDLLRGLQELRRTFAVELDDVAFVIRMRRRPELLWRVEAERLTSFAGRQLRLLEAAADLVRPGGRLVYSVCTFPRAETEAVCEALLRLRSDLRPLATPGPDGTSERHRLWPHRHGSDGMFVAAFDRSSALVAAG